MEETDVKERKRRESERRRLRQRRKAVLMVERQLKATWLYAPTGDALLSVGKQRENVRFAVSDPLDEDQGEKPDKLNPMDRLTREVRSRI